MDIKINFGFSNTDFKVEFLTEEEMYNLRPEKDNNTYYPYGDTSFVNRTIKINKEINEQEIITTLIHELMHTWMWVTANSGRENYTEEHICDMVSCSNLIINSLLKKILEQIEQIKSDDETRKRLVRYLEEIKI